MLQFSYPKYFNSIKGNKKINSNNLLLLIIINLLIKINKNNSNNKNGIISL